MLIRMKKTVITLGAGIIIGSVFTQLIVNSQSPIQSTASGSQHNTPKTINTLQVALPISSSGITLQQQRGEELLVGSFYGVKDIQEIDFDKNDLNDLNESMWNSPENVRLREIWELNKATLNWDDIERVAPNLTYEQKLSMETTLQDNPSDGRSLMLTLARHPNTGDKQKNMLYLALDHAPEHSSGSVFMIDSLIEGKCGRQAGTIELMTFIDTEKVSIEKAYIKRDILQLKELINNSDICNQF
ncbi:hypothetical protein FMO003_25220 [Moritella sp. F3]|nr:hypothetical protein FMO001_18490 [Moritella sp. F1]GIC82241.1 hypothetical protein FMO003_25220 [Moritella sp. F3]